MMIHLIFCLLKASASLIFAEYYCCFHSKIIYLKIYHSSADFKNCPNPILTTGTFDGVHIGHRKIINRLKEIADRVKGETVMLTFHPHPRMVLFPEDDSLKLLNSFDEKVSLLEEAGIDHLIVYPFSKEFSRITALEYARDLLVNQIGIHTIVVGYDHHFGRNREGNFQNLVEFGQIYGFAVEEISALELNEVNVSSTKIRRALEEGNIETATEYLGYSYQINGKVVHGDQLGTKLGFPTANVKVDADYKLIPGDGVYAVEARWQNQTFKGMLNIGIRPTINEEAEHRIEVNLFDFDSEIYEDEIALVIKAKIRNEKKFESLEELSAQLQKDKIKALDLLK